MAKAIYIYKHMHTCTHTQWTIIQPLKKEILPGVTTWMDLEGIMLSEISQRKTNTVCSHLYIECIYLSIYLYVSIS